MASTGAKKPLHSFLRRFLDDGIVGETDDILVNGPPWRTTIAVLFRAVAHDNQGALIYDNRAVLFAGSLGQDRLPRGLRRHPQKRGV